MIDAAMILFSRAFIASVRLSVRVINTAYGSKYVSEYEKKRGGFSTLFGRD